MKQNQKPSLILESPEQVIALIEQGVLNPERTVQYYPAHPAIVKAAYQKDPRSIKYAARDLINQLGSAGEISQADVLTAFSMAAPGAHKKLETKARFDEAMKNNDWEMVAKLCQKFWFEKPEHVKKDSIVEDLMARRQVEHLYQFELSFKLKQHELAYGPRHKANETVQLERLMRKMMGNEAFHIQHKSQGDYFIFEDGTAFNWTNIQKNANLQHIDLKEEDFAAYSIYVSHSQSRFRSGLDPKKERRYLQELYHGEYSVPQNLNTPCITFQEMQAINIYTNAVFFSKMNGLMRGDETKFNYSRKDDAKDLREVLIHSVMCASGLRKMPQTTLPCAYRYASKGTLEEQKERIKAAANKGVVQFDGFVSAGADQLFLAQAYQHKPVFYTLTNLRGVYVAPISCYEEEKEFLIPSTQVQITHYERRDDTDYFIASLVDEPNEEAFKSRRLDEINTGVMDIDTMVDLIEKQSITPDAEMIKEAAAIHPQLLEVNLNRLTRAELQALVRAADNEGHFIWQDIQKYPDSLDLFLKYLMTQGFNEELEMVFLNLPNPVLLNFIEKQHYEGNTILHLLIKTHLNILENVLPILLRAQLRDALMIKNHRGESALQCLMQEKPELLPALAPLSDAERMDVMKITYKQGNCIFHHLAERNPVIVNELLLALPEDERVQIFQITNGLGSSVLDWVIFYGLDEAPDIIPVLIESVPAAKRFELFCPVDRMSILAQINLYYSDKIELILSSLTASERMRAIRMPLPGQYRTQSLLSAAQQNPALLNILARYPDLVDVLPKPQVSASYSQTHYKNNVQALKPDEMPDEINIRPEK